MQSLGKDEKATIQVDVWRGAVSATAESIRTALLNQLSDKTQPGITIMRSDGYAMEVAKWGTRHSVRVLNFDSKQIVRRAWWAAPPSFRGRARLGWFEGIFSSKSGRFFSFEETVLIMKAFVEGGTADVPHQWMAITR